jgi:hypothetical protein
MTKGGAALPSGFDDAKDQPQVPPLRSPGFPVERIGFRELHAPFRKRKAHTLPCPVLRGRKSGFAPVGMTIHILVRDASAQEKLSSRKKSQTWDDKG